MGVQGWNRTVNLILSLNHLILESTYVVSIKGAANSVTRISVISWAVKVLDILESRRLPSSSRTRCHSSKQIKLPSERTFEIKLKIRSRPSSIVSVWSFKSHFGRSLGKLSKVSITFFTLLHLINSTLKMQGKICCSLLSREPWTFWGMPIKKSWSSELVPLPASMPSLTCEDQNEKTSLSWRKLERNLQVRGIGEMDRDREGRVIASLWVSKLLRSLFLIFGNWQDTSHYSVHNTLVAIGKPKKPLKGHLFLNPTPLILSYRSITPPLILSLQHQRRSEQTKVHLYSCWLESIDEGRDDQSWWSRCFVLLCQQEAGWEGSLWFRPKWDRRFLSK